MTNKQQPQRLDMQKMFDALTQLDLMPKRYYFHKDFAVVLQLHQALKPFLGLLKGPFLLEDYRMGIITKGHIEGVINLTKYEMSVGDAFCVCPGSIVEPLSMSDDFCVMGMGLSAEKMHLAHPGGLPELFGGLQKHYVQPISEQNQLLLGQMFHLLLLMACHCEAEATSSMVQTVTTFFSTLFSNQSAHLATSSQRTSANDIFDRFIQLVNRHCREQRQLDFYADKLCLTERYLGTVIRQTSGISAKEWIDKAVITTAKVMLRHTDKQVSEISDELHFPNPSFFCKYFKRLVGCTPQEFRRGELTVGAT